MKDVIIGKNLFLLRKSRKAKQIEVSNYLNITRGNYANYEKERRYPSLEVLIKIAQFFKVSLDFLVFGEKNNSTTPALIENLDDNFNREIMAENVVLMNMQNDLNNQLKNKNEEIQLLKDQLLATENKLKKLMSKKV